MLRGVSKDEMVTENSDMGNKSVMQRKITDMS